MRRPELWRVGVMLVGALLITTILTPLFFASIGWLAHNLRPFQMSSDGLTIGATPGGMFVILASFVFLLIGTVLMADRLHNRSLRDLTGPAPLMRAQFRATLKWIALFTVLSILLPWDDAPDPLANLSFGMWLFWVPFAVLGLLVQVSAEELFFRGYLQSQIAASTGSYPLGLAAASILFGIAHLNGSASGMAALFPVLWAMGFGAISGDLTMRAGTLGPSIALHLVNNFTAVLLVAQQDSMSGFGLYLQPMPPETLYSDPKVMVMQALLLLVTWLIARLAIRR